MSQSSIEWLNSNNETICSMLLLDKIPQSIYEQLINCFSMNFERAKEIHKQEIMDAWYNGFEENRPYVDHSEDYYNKTFNNNENGNDNNNNI